MRRFNISPFVAFSVSVALIHTTPARSEIVDRVLAQVDDEIVTQTDIVRLLPVYTQVYGVAPGAFESQRACRETLTSFQEFLVESTLLIAAARARGLSIETAEVDSYIAEQHERLRLTREQFQRELEATGVEFADFRDFIEMNLTRVRVLQLDVAARVNISDAEVEAEVSLRYPEGLEELIIDTSHLFVQVGQGVSEDVALAALQERVVRLRAGESFEELAAENEDGSARSEGRIGRLSVLDLDSDYARAALDLEVGGVSEEPVRSSFGWHLIRLEGRERQPVEDATRVRDQVLFELHQRESEQQQSLYLERIRNEAFVDIRSEDFDWYCSVLPE